VIKGDVTFVESGALRLWTERFRDPGDPVVLLIMGTSAQGIGWPDELVETLVNGGRQVVRFDHRDTGESDCVDFAADPYTLSDMAADALAVLNGQDVAAAHIAGASLGGRIGHAAPRPPARRADLVERPGVVDCHASPGLGRRPVYPKWIVSGLAALPRRGAVWKLLCGFSATLMVYECVLPFSIPCGSVITQANCLTETFQEQ
jgi:pimeloyl-ACP methyl ester carboxylesterase